MNYYLYNTCRKDKVEHTPFDKLIDGDFAATSGPYERYGRTLRKLRPSDTLLMYENRTGVVAVGTVQRHWDGKTYHAKDFLYFDRTEETWEYRIAVKWSKYEKVIGVEELLKRLDYISPLTLAKYSQKDGSVVRRLLEQWKRFIVP